MTQPTITRPPTIGTDWVPSGWPAPTTSPPPAPPAKRNIGRYIVGAVAIFFVGAGIASAGAASKKDTSSTGTVDSTATPAATTRATAPAVGTTSSVGTWAERYGSPDSELIVSDLNAMGAAGTAADTSGLGSSCRTLQRHLATVESHLPTPDAQLTSALSQAYGYYRQAMTTCISGTANMDVDDLRESATYMSLATGAIQRATARLELLS